MLYEAKLKFARKCDRQDPLKKFRKLFFMPEDKDNDPVYLCGNSLGLLSKSVKPAINQELKDWKNKAIAGYMHAKHPWMYYQHNFNKSLAKIMGCEEHEVTVMNALTVNLHLLLLSFYKPTPERYKIIMEAGAFPSDQYAVASQVKFHNYNPEESIIEVSPRPGEKTLRTEDILRVIDEHKNGLAIVLFGGINYYTGQLFDISSITKAAHHAGAFAGFDLAHVAGNVPMELHKWEVDFAVWCSYKYLNAGPGSVAGIYIHERFANAPNFPRLAGWWGNQEKTRFQMVKEFTPQPGAAGWSISTAQVFNMVALKASLKIIDKAGIENIRQKSILLTGYLEYLLNELKHLRFEIITPGDPGQRGAQLSLYFNERGKEIHQQMIKKGIVVDYREPGVIRVAPAPLYNSFSDVYRFYEILDRMK
jgi:kynureninase